MILKLLFEILFFVYNTGLLWDQQEIKKSEITAGLSPSYNKTTFDDSDEKLR